MLFSVNIAKQLRVVLTAITLLLMVGLNNREVTTYAVAPAAETGQQVDKSAATERHGIVKEKVSFEATPSYVVLQLATSFPELSNFDFVKPVLLHLTPQYPAGVVLGYFKTLLSTSIQVNAP